MFRRAPFWKVSSLPLFTVKKEPLTPLGYTSTPLNTMLPPFSVIPQASLPPKLVFFWTTVPAPPVVLPMPLVPENRMALEPLRVRALPLAAVMVESVTFSFEVRVTFWLALNRPPLVRFTVR